MPLPSALARNKTKTASSGIWTRVVDSISYDDNWYANNTSIYKAKIWLRNVAQKWQFEFVWVGREKGEIAKMQKRWCKEREKK